MRSRTTLLSGFRGSLPGRVMLPVGFALILAAGTYMVAESEGYQRGKTDQANAQESVKNLARLVAQPIELDAEPTEKGDQLDIPKMIRAIEPSAVYRPTEKAAAKPVRPAGTVAATTPVSLPVGVERFDRCEGNCDTRDPMITHSSYPVLVSTSAPAPAASAPASGTPAPTAPQARAEEDESFLGLPSLPSAGEIVDRTVQGTSATYDTMKQAVSGAIDFLR